jgi:actin-like ATPase involved in cell morphogenesis
MTYQVGIDLGTTYTAAAVYRDGRVQVASLGDQSPSVPSVLYLDPSGQVTVGDGANRRGLGDPSRVAREFKRRMGDPTPITVGDAQYAAEALTARLLTWVLRTVADQQGGEAAQVIALSHPANWGTYKLDRLREAASQAGLDQPVFLSEPEAAAISYASQERVPAGATVAVYDLGGGTFDAAVLRKTAAGGFELLGEPEGIERLGGIDFDSAVFAHVGEALGGAIEELDPDDDAALAAAARLRHECTAAKEALSFDVEATVPVLLPNIQTEVRLTRAELEAMMRPPINETVGALRRAVESAGISASDLHAVLLVGGSSRVPLVAQLVSAALGRPVALDAHTKHAVALGAALAAARAAGVTVTEPEAPLPPEPVYEAAVVAASAPGPPPPRPMPPPPPPASPPPPPPPAAPPAAPPRPAPAPPPPTSPPPPASPAPTPAPPPSPPPTPAPPPSPPQPAPVPGESPPIWTGAPVAPPPPAPPPPAAPPPAPPGPPPMAAPPPGAPPPGWATAAAAPPPGAPPPTDSGNDTRRRNTLIGLGALVVVAILAVAFVALTGGGGDAGPTLTPVEQLTLDQCINGLGREVEIVECTAPHTAQVFAFAEPLPGAFPGDDPLFADVSGKCVFQLVGWYGALIEDAVAAGLDIKSIRPKLEDWNTGWRRSVCVVVRADGVNLTESLKGKGTGT